MPANRPSAVVIGASLGGLLTARVLSTHFDHVTIVEKDALTDTEGFRKGVPQSVHAHGLLAGGFRVMDTYFPGMMEDLASQGAQLGDVVGDLIWFQDGHWKTRHHSDLPGISVSRQCLELAVRRRVKALPNVVISDETQAVKPVFDSAKGRVTGLVVRKRRGQDDEATLDADLVVDTSGRGSSSPQWLEDMGYDRPQEIQIKINVGYATRLYQRTAGDFHDAFAGVISDTPPVGTRYAAVFGVERDRWIVTLGGTVGDYPPTDEQGWIEFAKHLPVPAVHELITTATPLTDISSYRFPSNQRRFYERMKRFPEGYLVLGDAICSFNPVYGQGMSVAAMEAKALDDTLAAGGHRLSQRFYTKAAKIIDIPWMIVIGEDFRFPQVQGIRPPGHRFVSRYLHRVHAIAAIDPEVCRRFFNVANLIAHPYSLMSPSMVWRVFRQAKPERGIHPRQRRHAAEPV